VVLDPASERDERDEALDPTDVPSQRTRLTRPGPRIGRVEVGHNLRNSFAIDLLDGVLDGNVDPE
jgi:hypothetical protein